MRLTHRGELEAVSSAAIRAGDILQLRENDRVPADCVFLQTTSPSGQTSPAGALPAEALSSVSYKAPANTHRNRPNTIENAQDALLSEATT